MSKYELSITTRIHNQWDIEIAENGKVVEIIQLNNFYTLEDARRIGSIALEVYRRQEKNDDTS